MSDPAKTTRRDFLQGKSAVRALEGAVSGTPDELPPPVAQAARTYLLAIARQAMACEFEVLLNAPHASRVRSQDETMIKAAAAKNTRCNLLLSSIVDTATPNVSTIKDTACGHKVTEPRPDFKLETINAITALLRKRSGVIAPYGIFIALRQRVKRS